MERSHIQMVIFCKTMGFQCGTKYSTEPTCKYRRHKEHKFDPWVGKIHWGRTWQHIPVFLPGESHGQRNLEGYSPCGLIELNTTEATWHAHSIILTLVQSTNLVQISSVYSYFFVYEYGCMCVFNSKQFLSKVWLCVSTTTIEI